MKSAHCSTERRFQLVLILPISLAILIILSACAPVQPWERGRLAQPQMAMDGDALQSAMDEHVYSSKEAASGGAGPAGGGCGCN
jgi:hypothetical protein